MPGPPLQDVELQLIMAFGQGSGSMMASAEALRAGLSSQQPVIQNAMNRWSSARFALYELVRLAGQIAAARAALDGRPEIDSAHVIDALQIVLGICPCRDVGP